MNFAHLLTRAKANDPYAINELVELYKNLLRKEATVNGVLDEDLYQELLLTLMNCISRFSI